MERIEEICAGVFRLYGFCPLRTPIFESTDLFTRHIGETTDVVVKEMYTFLDRKGRSLTLRPEGTAPVVRALVQHSLLNQGLDRFYYIGPMFRYERPQAGRYRQHHQVGVEAFGDSRPEVDVEVIACMVHVLGLLGLEDLKVKINSLGNHASRERYGEALRDYLEARKDELDPVSQERLKRNPMRLLDEKSPKVQALLKEAPRFRDFLEEEDLEHHRKVLEGLQSVGVSFQEDPMLVRGFDYYNRTAFEVVTEALGAQDAIGGGGRYDSLVQDVGGPATPGMGFGMGVERVMLLLEKQQRQPPSRNDPKPVFLVCLDDQAREEALVVANKLRQQGIPVRAWFKGGKPLKQFQRAEKLGCRYAVILGQQERDAGVLGLRDLETREQREVTPEELREELTRL
jgi:histidyl-tRNA synthetase